MTGDRRRATGDAHADRPLIVAHRGARSVAPENTVEAFLRAGELGADGVELDVRLTVDGHLVVHHDAVIAGETTPINRLGLTEVRRRHPAVPTLSEAMEACGDLWVDIEVKNNPADPDWDPEDRAVHTTIEEIDRIGARDRVLVSSFNLPTVDEARAAGLETGWLLPRGIEPLTAAGEWPGHRWVLPSKDAVQGPMADRVVEAFIPFDVRVGVWTVNDPDEMLRLARAGVKAIFTDDMELAVRTLRG
ncbi:MAG TPA: glycerophosphodiester phosphodiesterase [Acidimicrobiia bacterium]|nr:glycerophosphodiester phosphodiesterase [Acidimicrobiia bacterium]